MTTTIREAMAERWQRWIGVACRTIDEIRTKHGESAKITCRMSIDGRAMIWSNSAIISGPIINNDPSGEMAFSYATTFTFMGVDADVDPYLPWDTVSFKPLAGDREPTLVKLFNEKDRLAL